VELDVLLVEDDEALARALTLHLRSERWSVRWVSDGEAAIASCRELSPDVVILDLMLPGRTGLEICTALRTNVVPTPGVLMLTARGGERDVVMGLDHGADDYVVKPCRPKELTARIRALARRLRAGAAAAFHELSVGRLRIDPVQRLARVGERELSLTPTELSLLEVFAHHIGRVLSRMALLEKAFDSVHAGYARNVDCHVARLRRKLESIDADIVIESVYGTGYRFSCAQEKT